MELIFSALFWAWLSLSRLSLILLNALQQERVVTFDINYIIFWEFRIAHCLPRKFRFLLFLTLFSFKAFIFKNVSPNPWFACFFGFIVEFLLELSGFGDGVTIPGPGDFREKFEVEFGDWQLCSGTGSFFFNSWIRLFWLIWPIQICHKKSTSVTKLLKKTKFYSLWNLIY